MELIPKINSDKVVIVGQAEKKYETKKWEIKQYPGHKIFEINTETGDTVEATFEEVTLQINDMGKPINLHLQMAATGQTVPQQEIKKKMVVKDNCMYISALNIQNAAKKFAKQAQKLM